MEKTNIDNLDPKQRALETRHILIDGMTCDECVKTIERALTGIKGVERVKVTRSTRTATVVYDSRYTDIPALHDALLKHGYKPTPATEPC